MNTAVNFRNGLNAILVGEPAVSTQPLWPGESFMLAEFKAEGAILDKYVERFTMRSALTRSDIFVPYSLNDFFGRSRSCFGSGTSSPVAMKFTRTKHD